MNYIDQAVHNNNPETTTNDFVPEDWNRLRDNVYVPWTHTEEQLGVFMLWLNSIHSSLRFTESHSVLGTEFGELYVSSDEHNNI